MSEQEGDLAWVSYVVILLAWAVLIYGLWRWIAGVA